MPKGSMRFPPPARRSLTVSVTDRKTGAHASNAVSDPPAPVKFAVDHPEAQHSTTGVTLSYRMSRGYCSVEMQAHVTVPCETGHEQAGMTYARDEAGSFIDENKELVENTLLDVLDTAYGGGY